MKLCRVVGKASASIKHAGLGKYKILIVQDLETDGQSSGELTMAVDVVGAGAGDVVAVINSGYTVNRIGGGDLLCDVAVVAIMDHVFVNGKEINAKNEEK